MGCFKSNRDELEVLADLLRLNRSDNQIDFENVSLKEEEHFDNIINQDGISQRDSFELFTDSGVPMVERDEMINALDSPEPETELKQQEQLIPRSSKKLSSTTVNEIAIPETSKIE